jgi:hypothetical protein
LSLKDEGGGMKDENVMGLELESST